MRVLDRRPFACVLWLLVLLAAAVAGAAALPAGLAMPASGATSGATAPVEPLPPDTDAAPGAARATPRRDRESGKVAVQSFRIPFQEAIYQYFVYAPEGYAERPARPAIVLLHGGGGNGLQSIAAWRELADEKGILLIAPTLPSGEAIEPVAPPLLRTILANVRRTWKLDPRRVYLFGHSAGGVLTFDAAMMDADLFAAAAAHAAVIDPDYDWILKTATRKTPMAIYIGDHDAFFSLARARRTRDKLTAEGFPLHYVELPGHDHNYGAVASQVNRDAWTYLSRYTLPN